MIFLWSWRNEEHLTKHAVAPAEANELVERAKPPYPEDIGDHKWSVRGRTRAGRFLQVIYLYAAIEDIEPNEFAQLRPDEREAMSSGAEAVRIIHGRPLTESEKRRLRRREKR
jgi:hypothetical protein